MDQLQWQQSDSGDQAMEGLPINLERYFTEVGEGTRPELPQDGRYWVMMARTYDDDETRLLWEKAATYQEAKQCLKTFQDSCHRKPRRVNRVHIDDVDGLWGVQHHGKQFEVLHIWHPSIVGVDRDVRWIREASGLDSGDDYFLMDSDLGRDPGEWTTNPSIPMVRYSTLLRDALIGVTQYREAPDLLVDLGIDGRSKSIDGADRLVNAMEDQLRRLTSRIDQLEECSSVPPELLELQVKSVEFLRAVRKVHKLNCEALTQSFMGNKDEKRRLNAEAEKYISNLEQALPILAAELSRIKATDRRLYSALDIPTDILESLNLS